MHGCRIVIKFRTEGGEQFVFELRQWRQSARLEYSRDQGRALEELLVMVEWVRRRVRPDPAMASCAAASVVAVAAIALTLGAADSSTEIVMSIRAPRVVMAVLVGSGLALAGALMQGGLANPLVPDGVA